MNPAVRFTEYMYDQDTLHIYEGIRIVCHGHREEAGPFINRVVKALGIIKSNDPRRFRRVQRLRFIVNSRTPLKDALGCYHPVFRECVVDFDKLENLHGAWHRPEALAMLIVHEATHCLLHDLFGDTDDIEFQLRIEALCYREQARFMQRLGIRISAEFDAESYRQDWQRTRFERFLDGVDSISESLPPGKRRRLVDGVGRVLRSVHHPGPIEAPA